MSTRRSPYRGPFTTDPANPQGYGGGSHHQDPGPVGHYSGLHPQTFGHIEEFPIVDGIIDDPGCRVRRNERQHDDADEFRIELMTGNVFFRGGGTKPEQRPDTTVHVRRVEVA